MDGLLPVWKPTEITSYDVIRIVKREVLKKLPEKVKIGHAGTLDPFAEGVLILMLGRGTRKFDEIQTWPKTYRAVAKLGAKSDTLDKTGNIVPIHSDTVSRDAVERALKEFVGEIEQVVPQYSAAKYQGMPRYKYARKGELIPEKSKKVQVYSIEVVGDPLFNYSNNRSEMELLISCSSGTYIRQLSYDIFRSLGIESYLYSLVREAVGKITRAECLPLDQLADADMVRQRVRHAHDG